MKRLFFYLSLCVVLISGCKKYERVVPELKLHEKDGLRYEQGASKAFTGIMVRLYPNGSKQADIHYVNGKAHGGAVFYDRDGNVEAQGEFCDGEKDGGWFFYKQNQKIADVGFSNGKLNGKSTHYRADGSVELEEIYKHNKRFQFCEYYDNGNLHKKHKIDEDTLRLEIGFYSKDGKLLLNSAIDIKQKTGKVTFCDSSSEMDVTLKLTEDQKHWDIYLGADIARMQMDVNTYIITEKSREDIARQVKALEERKRREAEEIAEQERQRKRAKIKAEREREERKRIEARKRLERRRSLPDYKWAELETRRNAAIRANREIGKKMDALRDPRTGKVLKGRELEYQKLQREATGHSRFLANTDAEAARLYAEKERLARAVSRGEVRGIEASDALAKAKSDVERGNYLAEKQAAGTITEAEKREFEELNKQDLQGNLNRAQAHAIEVAKKLGYDPAKEEEEKSLTRREKREKLRERLKAEREERLARNKRAEELKKKGLPDDDIRNILNAEFRKDTDVSSVDVEIPW